MVLQSLLCIAGSLLLGRVVEATAALTFLLLLALFLACLLALFLGCLLAILQSDWG